MTREVMITTEQDKRLKKLAPKHLQGTNQATVRVRLALDQFVASLDPTFVPEGGKVYAAITAEN
jgi:hypothetical protein